MLVAAPNDTATTSITETDGENDFSTFVPKTQLERALLNATQKSRKNKKDPKFKVTEFIKEKKETLNNVHVNQVQKIYEESKLKVQKINQILTTSQVDLLKQDHEISPFEAMYQMTALTKPEDNALMLLQA